MVLVSPCSPGDTLTSSLLVHVFVTHKAGAYLFTLIAVRISPGASAS